ncbi:restriction endonuclease subunit S [Limosilactobacillus reuteri]|uniref:restriction endonuclease subunit S n=2 Tax=Limosilactobacillus reuteri TaxID=1598 RepID=UPI00235F4743|nr:restriction endonuclease subunit S [Limosilactobacillus reuteri]MDD1400904.1 restriction endonuclease subunit S [Limosilactobacillus reuteri]
MKKQLGEIANLKYGKMPNKDLIRDSGYPIFTGYKISGFYPIYMYDKSVIIIVARGVGGTGDVKIAPPKSFITNLSIIVDIINDKLINKKYLQLLLGSLNLRNLDSGSAQSQITIAALSKVELDLPKKDIQDEIASKIELIERKIQLNKRINDNLISLATTLFNKYFPNINSGNEMIGNFISNYDRLRKPLSKKERLSIPGKYRYIGATSVNDYINKYNFDGIYLLLGEDGTVEDDNGYPILQYISGKFWPNNHAHVLQGKNVSTEWLYLFFKQRKITSIVTGAVQKKISQKNLNSLSISIPDKDKLARFDTIINPIFKNIRIIESENHSLEKIKLELLSKLF